MNAEEVNEKIIELSIPDKGIIPVELIRASGKIRTIINSDDDSQTFRLRDDSYEFEFKEPLFVEYVFIQLDKYETLKGFKVDILDPISRKQKKSIVCEKSESGIRFSFNATASGFVILKSVSLFSKSIKNIVVSGYVQEDFSLIDQKHKESMDFKSKFSDWSKAELDKIDAEKSDLAKKKILMSAELVQFNSRRDELSSDVDRLDNLKRDTESAVASVESSLKKLTLEKQQAQESLSRIELMRSSAESELASVVNALSETRRDIASKEKKLSELINNVNSFAEEFSAFVDQGARQERMYVFLSIIPLAIVSAVVWHMYQGAVNLSVMYNKLPSMDIWTVFVTRLPYVAISVFIIGVCLKVCFYLFEKVVDLHKRKLDLSSITVLAKDITLAASEGLNLTQDEIFERRTYLKMKMLRAHLNTLIGDFRYESEDSENLSKEVAVSSVSHE